MKIFRCIISGDEMLCDNDRPLPEQDDVVFAVQGRYVEIGGEDFGLGANADEDADEGATAETLQEGKQKVIDVIHNNRLVETQYDKKSFAAHIKNYMKALKEHLEKTNPDRVAAFQAGAQTFVKKVIGEFDDYQFFMGPSMHDEGQTVLCKWNGETPTFFFWKDGLKGERV